MKRLLLGLILAVLIAFPAHFGYAADKTLVLYLSFDEGKGDKAEDGSTYGNDADVSADVEWGEGHSGTAVKVPEGGQNCVTVPHSDSLVIEEEITIMAWLNIPELKTSDTNQWLDKASHNGGENKTYSMWLNEDGSIGGRLGSDQNRQGYSGGDARLEDGKWEHVALTVDEKSTTVYVNGILANKEDKGWRFEGTTEFDLNIGCPKDRAGKSFNGFVDEVVIYSRALSEAEVNQVMTSGMAVSAKGKLSTTWASIKNQ